MAAYTCYADNGLAPVANATFLLEVQCKYAIKNRWGYTNSRSK